MKCPLLNTWDIPTCLSSKGIIIPSLSDLKEFCRTDNHVNCPVFRNQPIEKTAWLPFCQVVQRPGAAVEGQGRAEAYHG